MVICDFNILSASVCPSEAEAPLPVNTDAVLSGSIPFKRFQPIARRNSQIIEICGNFKLSQFPAGNSGDPRKSLDAVSFRKGLGIGALKRSNHLKL
jgi:hypothetical protein